MLRAVTARSGIGHAFAKFRLPFESSGTQGYSGACDALGMSRVDGARFVSTCGGDYFFAPSMTALRMIGMGLIDPT